MTETLPEEKEKKHGKIPINIDLGVGKISSKEELAEFVARLRRLDAEAKAKQKDKQEKK